MESNVIKKFPSLICTIRWGLKVKWISLISLHSPWLWIKRHANFLFSRSRCWREHHQPTWREKSELGLESPEVIFFITLEVDQHDVPWAPHRRRNWETTQESYKGEKRTQLLSSAVKYFSAGPISQIRKRSSLSLNHLRKVESRFWEKKWLKPETFWFGLLSLVHHHCPFAWLSFRI